VEGYANRAKATWRLARAQAVDQLEESQRRNPGLPGLARSLGQAWSILAQAEAERGGDPRDAWEKAVESFDRAAAANPSDSEAVMARGHARVGLALARAAYGEDAGSTWSEAEGDLRAAGAGGSIRAAVDLGRLLLSSSRFDEAEVVFAGIPGSATEDRAAADAGIAEARRMLALSRQGGWAAELLAAGQLYRRGEMRASCEHYDRGLRLLDDHLVAMTAAERARNLGDARVRAILSEAYFALASIRCCAAVGKAGPAAQPRPVPAEEAVRCRDEAFHLLDRARELGLDPRRLSSDPQLEPLRVDPRWPGWLGKER